MSKWLQGLDSLTANICWCRYLSQNDFTSFPDQVFQLSNLQSLHFTGNAKISELTFTQEQLNFLKKLTVFTIDSNSLTGWCEFPEQVHGYSICVVGDPSLISGSAANNSSAKGVSAIVYVLSGAAVVAVAFVAAIGIVRYRKRTSNGKDNVEDSIEADKDMFCLEEMDIDKDSILESTRHGVEYLMSSATFSSHSLLSSKGSSRFVSVWDDEELLKWRVDAQQIQDVEVLAAGFYGEVWLASYLGKPVAVKRMKKSPAEQIDRAEIQHFITEIKLYSRLRHPKIVSFIGVAWTMESDIQVVVEYMVNGDLCSYISSFAKCSSEDAWSEAERATAERSSTEDNLSHWSDTTWQIATDIAEALVYMHSFDPPVLHRDLKSRNVLLNEDLHAKVTDFGVSRYQDDDDDSVSVDVGTARWAAPEVLAGSSRYSEAVDIYSLGVILSELETFRIPYAELGISEAHLLSRVTTGDVQPSFTESAPFHVVDLARQCLSFDPASRPSAVQVAYLLRQMRTPTSSRTSDASSSALSYSVAHQMSNSPSLL